MLDLQDSAMDIMALGDMPALLGLRALACWAFWANRFNHLENR
jgi:hypothetical protein